MLFTCQKFIWHNLISRGRIKGDVQSIHAKLDKCLENLAFKQAQPHCHIVVIPMVSSDHHLLKMILMSQNILDSRQKPMCMEPWWFSHTKCPNLVTRDWFCDRSYWQRWRVLSILYCFGVATNLECSKRRLGRC